MKNNILLNTLFLVLLLSTGLSSCQKVLDVNTDPNNLSAVTPDLLLTNAETGTASTVGNTWNYIGSMWAEYWTGGYGVSTSQLEYFNMSPTDMDGVWGRAYARSLMDYANVIKTGNDNYKGIAKIMSAYTYQMLTDLHGAVPMSEALKGEAADGGIISPKYDSEQDVYAAVLTMIDDAKANLSTTVPSIDEVGADDVVYGGDLSKWNKFANTLKLKVLVRSGDYAAARTLIDAGTPFISSSSDEAKQIFTETAQNTNPLWARFESRTTVGMYYVGAKASVDKLVALGDPRVNTIYTAGNAGHEGVYSGDLNDNTVLYPSGGSNSRFSKPNTTHVFNANVPVFYISAWESKLLQAEVLMRTGGTAATLFEEGVQASFTYYGLGSASAYFASLGYSDAGTLNDKIKILAVQKWIAMNGLQMAEGWLETLRLETSTNPIFRGVAPNNIFTSPINNSLGANNYPSSFLYPSTETSYNPKTPTDRTVTSKRFWDN